MITEDTEELMQRVEIAAAAIDVLTDERDRLRGVNAEMMLVLEDVVQAWDGTDNADDIEWGKIVDNARAAIRRATGEET